jgi:hypothetical protein
MVSRAEVTRLAGLGIYDRFNTVLADFEDKFLETDDTVLPQRSFEHHLQPLRQEEERVPYLLEKLNAFELAISVMPGKSGESGSTKSQMAGFVLALHGALALAPQDKNLKRLKSLFERYRTEEFASVYAECIPQDPVTA